MLTYTGTYKDHEEDSKPFNVFMFQHGPKTKEHQTCWWTFRRNVQYFVYTSDHVQADKWWSGENESILLQMIEVVQALPGYSDLLPSWNEEDPNSGVAATIKED